MGVCVSKKIKLIKGQNMVVTSTNLDRVVREDLPEEVTFEQRLE